MGLISEINLVLGAAKRVAAFTRASEKGLSPEEARKESIRYFPMNSHDIEYEAYLRQTNRPLGRIPWISTLALASPLTAVFRISSHTKDVWTIAGYGITQLGYVLFVAGVISGKFGVFNLARRRWTFGCAVICLVIGIIFTNLRS